MTKTGSEKACCTPSGGGAAAAERKREANNFVPATTEERKRAFSADAILIPGGPGLIGTQQEYILHDGEAPLRNTKVKPFLMAPTAVTNAEFAKFVEATNFVTEAEEFGWSFVFWSAVSKDIEMTQAAIQTQWWRKVDGATWRDINGPGTEAEAWHPDHPAVHISWNDAEAYARWVGGRLPSEAEWEHAARGGQGDVKFPWGDAEPNDTDSLPCNIWQGHFPNANSCADGYSETAPAKSFQANPFGLYNMVGNVWEWTAETYKIRSLKKPVKEKLKSMRGYKLLKGGSFLCHKSYCYRYRIAARSGNSPDSTTTHQGFRVVWDA